jgi:hypothetical protein
MNPLELKIGQWVKFEYNGAIRRGQIEEAKFGTNATCSKIVNGRRVLSNQTGWLLKTQDGYRHFKVAKMDKIRIEN